MNLLVLPGTLVVARLAPDAPAPAEGRGFWSLTRTAEELSLVCAPEAVPAGAATEGPFRALMVQGPLDFALIGILAELTAVLAKAGISLFALSTFDTDYLLLRAERLQEAIAALRAAGHGILEP